MRTSRLTILVTLHNVWCFVPCRRLDRTSRILSAIVDEDIPTDRCLEKLREFNALAEEGFRLQREELNDILRALRQLEEMADAPISPSQAQSSLLQFGNGEHFATGASTPQPPLYGMLLQGTPPNVSERAIQESTGRPTTSIPLPDCSHSIGIETAEAEVALQSTYSLLAGSSFQLEEIEDRDGCSTEITLEEDRTVTVGVTDGPRFARATGTWIALAGELDMLITRHFEAGHKSRDPTALGEFSFAVERAYLGQIVQVGDRLAVSGTIHCTDESWGDEDLEVGYFNMIDNREGDDINQELEGIKRIPMGRNIVS